jgi:clan AA aspartic protease
MISGAVDARNEARIRLQIRGPQRDEQMIDALIDTGFTGFLTLPSSLIEALRLPHIGQTRAILANGSEVVLNLYEADVDWDGRWLTVETDLVDAGPLVGMGLLAGYRLCLDAVASGHVTIEALP